MTRSTPIKSALALAALLAAAGAAQAAPLTLPSTESKRAAASSMWACRPRRSS